MNENRFSKHARNIDSSTSGGKLIFHMFSALAEFERDLIRERTEAGLKQQEHADGWVEDRHYWIIDKLIE